MTAFDVETLLTALKLGETQDWEFKSAKGGLPRSFWETYSAMANSEGGTIVLGVAERDDRLVPDGLTSKQLAQYQKAIFDGAHNKATVNRDLLGPGSVEVANLKDVELIIVRIPRAGRMERPVFVGSTPFGNTYRRAFEGDYRCDDGEVRRMFADADPVSPDRRILRGFGLEDLDPQSLAQYRLRMLAAQGQHPWLALSDKEFLTQLGGWRADRASGQDGLTLGGLLMFGKNLAIRDPEAAPNFFVDYRERLDPVLRYTDRLSPDGTWEANLFQFYQRVVPKIMAGVPTPFVLEGAERRDFTPAHEALREAIVNALIHGDYRVGGGVVFERYPDRFQIENPGTLLVSLEQYHRGGTSECRNPSLQIMFRLLGGGEQAGSGVARIKQGWASRQWRSPSIELTSQPDRVRLTLPMVSLIPDSALAVLREQLGTETDGLDADELQALATAAIEGQVSNSRLQDLTSLHPTDITRLLVGLCGRGFLRSDNKRRWTSYRLADGAYPQGGKAPDSLHKGEDSDHAGAYMDQLMVDSYHKGTDSDHKDGDSYHKSNADLHQKEAGQFQVDDGNASLDEASSNVARSRRASVAAVRASIVRLCEGNFLESAEIGRLLNRSPSNVRQRYLSPMVEEGLLELRYPESPTRPDQAYRTRSDPDR